MPALAVIGGQWGDEGKGKVVDLLAEKADYVVRYAGGNNAGHTVINPLGTFAMHLIPCGIFHEHPVCVIGNGVVVDPAGLLAEIASVKAVGVKLEGRLALSDRAHLVMPYHRLLDRLSEQARGSAALGTTQRGIGPAYADKMYRIGVRAADLLEPDVLRERLTIAVEEKNRVLTAMYGAEPMSLEALIGEHLEYGRQLAPYITDTQELLNRALDDGRLVLLEGAQGTMLDIDFGTYPYVTSSSPGITGAPAGAGIAPGRIDRVLGVYKAYTTRVGSGPMPTELLDDMGEYIRTTAQEYGATTGRPRRCGWFDGVAARLSMELNRFAGAALVRLDVLDNIPTLKLCVAYKYRDQTIKRFPSSLKVLSECEPVYLELPGWEGPTKNIRTFEELPHNAQEYVRRIEDIVGCPMDLVSVGPSREQTVEVRSQFALL